mmetsp:Transcript_18109/g.43554  ORF Transcript_18109/g.43554 Transcript_18109/m.43554 type:complete len:455 (-) Transcript_18109:266-1630(-)|eukprot:CAMPEP_0181138012 /NCGR_PEP_ID=MMETSP1071-20121207/34015_1 /TAXON_ID=35127 /ORGANISM="Thalassiosira sp., Strain NH16" /LENGTH=454 /DNA_ID=CAMNT_0023224811 /DNA_START=264 /DNA_END=1628 /DNA_ORIENTATION=-
MSSLCQPKPFVLFLLVVQNTCHVLLMRYTRTRSGTMFLASTAVCCDEAMKLVTCFGILIFAYLCQKCKASHGAADRGGKYSRVSTGDDIIMNDVSCCVPIGNPFGVPDGESHVNATTQQTMIHTMSSAIINGDGVEDTTAQPQKEIHHESFLSYLGSELQFDIRVAVVAGLFTVQKNLLYLAISNLDAAVFQVTYQAKVLTTALFSVLILKRKLGVQQIVALVLLTLGVALVQLDKVDDNKGSGSSNYVEQNHWVGLLAVLAACCTSGFGGVYFELVLKPKPSTNPEIDHPPLRPPPSVWAKNVQLSAFGFLIALTGAFAKDHVAILSDGFFQGYTPFVLLTITFQAMGGLIVAAIIKYADNILKSFASGASIVTSTLVSAWLFGFAITEMFALGTLLQFVAIWMYSKKGGEAADCRTSKLPVQDSDGIAMVSSDVGSIRGLSRRAGVSEQSGL